MEYRIENICGRLISQTFRVINPIKKKIINTNCEVHLFIQKSALDILKEDYAQRFDADFVLMTGILSKLTENLLDEFGGEKVRLG